MAKGWKCARCSTSNVETAITCAGCGGIRGSVVPVAPETLPPAPPSGTWEPQAEPPRTWGPQAESPATEAPPSGSPDTLAPGAESPTPPPDAWIAPNRPSVWQRTPVRLLIIVGVIAIGVGYSWYTNASRAPSGEITKTGDMTITDLRVGDCFDLKDPAAEEIDKVTATPCAGAHEYELFYVGSLPEGEYPAESVFETYVEDNCTPAFGAYVGKAFEDSELSVFWVIPNTDAWSDGDRSVQCAVYHPRIHRLTESLKGSAR